MSHSNDSDDQLRDLVVRTLRSQSDLPKQKVWRRGPSEMGPFLTHLGEQGVSLEEVIGAVERSIAPYAVANNHPRFMGWYLGSNSEASLAAAVLQAGLNASCSFFQHAPNQLEEVVLSWLSGILRLPHHKQGLLTSGASMSNLLAAYLARRTLRSLPNLGPESKPICYLSNQSHFSMSRAVQMAGPHDAVLRVLPTTAAGVLEAETVRSAIESDVHNGDVPFMISATIGTAAAGSIDQIGPLAELARNSRLWFHIDGAFGVLARVLERFHEQTAGSEFADSIAFDLHKWLGVSVGTGCLLIHDNHSLESAFDDTASYLTPESSPLVSETANFSARGVEVTRPFRALETWMVLKHLGVQGVRERIRACLETSAHAARAIRASEHLELAFEPTLNVIVFRWKSPELEASALDRINREALRRLTKAGDFVISSASLGETFYLRLAIANPATSASDIDELLDLVKKASRFAAERREVACSS